MEDNQQSLDGSNDSLGKKQRKFDLDFAHVALLPDQNGLHHHIDTLPANSPHTAEYIQTNKHAICEALLSPGVQEQARVTLQHVKEKRVELEAWIKEAFEVDDLEQQIYLLNAKRRFSEIDDPNEQTKAAEEKPKLRLKLSSADTTAAANHPEQPAQTANGGRGAKNLGRMSRTDQQQPDLKPKVPNQVPVTTFWNFIEPHFKRIDENDVKYLDDPNRIIDPTPFTIPPLGRHYLEQWREQYGYVTSAMGIRALPVPTVCSLKDRLLSMLVPLSDEVPAIDYDDIEQSENLANPIHDHISAPPTNNSLDQRLRRELADAGFLDYAMSGKDHQEDDELCQELRRLQNKLRECTMLNQYRKRRLANHIRTRILPAQELYHLIDEIDKQLCALYLKAQRNRKKGTVSAGKKSGTSSSSAIPDNHAEVHRLAVNRGKLLQAFGGSVGPRSTYLGSGNMASRRLFEQAVESRLRQDAKQLGLWFLE